MEAVGCRGIAFTPTGKAALLLGSGEWLIVTAAQGGDLVRGRKEEGLPPIPVIDPPAALPVRDPLGERPDPRGQANFELPPSVIAKPLVSRLLAPSRPPALCQLCRRTEPSHRRPHIGRPAWACDGQPVSKG